MTYRTLWTAYIYDGDFVYAQGSDLFVSSCVSLSLSLFQAEPPRNSRQLKILTILHREEVLTLKRMEKVGRIIELLKECDHNGFPVVLEKSVTLCVTTTQTPARSESPNVPAEVAV